MKIRFGFISNSSSTSFTCPACNTSFSGWDWDEDPICPTCNCHIDYCKETFADFLINKYDLDKEIEQHDYIRKQKMLCNESDEDLDDRIEKSLGRRESTHGW